MVAIVVHLMRVFFTGAFRKPRDANWLIGVTLVTLGLLEGFAGYSLADDLLSGMGLAIAYGVALSIPLVGGQLAVLIWDGEFPGGPDFISRLFITHVLIVPVVIAVLITLHLAIIVRQKHSQFRGPGRTERNVIGTPLWPAYAFRALGMMLATAAVLFLLGGLDPGQPDLAVRPVRAGPGHQRRPARLVHGLADRGAAPNARIRRDDRRRHDRRQPLLRRRAVPDGRVHRALRLARARAAPDARPRAPRPAGPPSRRPLAHGAGGAGSSPGSS